MRIMMGHTEADNFLHVSTGGPRSLLRVFLPVKHDIASIMIGARRNSCIRSFTVEKHCYADLCG